LFLWQNAILPHGFEIGFHLSVKGYIKTCKEVGLY